MPRAVSGVVRHKRVKKILKRAKGFKGRKGSILSMANQTVKRAMANEFVGRKLRKRTFRRLWNVRISAGSRQFGLSYSKFIYGLKNMSVTLNRKMLAHIATNSIDDFKEIVDLAKQGLNVETHG